MPYIEQKDRNLYIHHLDELISELSKQNENDLGGHLNYCVSYLMKRLFADKKRYVRANTIRGSIENALTEWYRCNVAEYEDQKSQENGNV